METITFGMTDGDCEDMLLQKCIGYRVRITAWPDFRKQEFDVEIVSACGGLNFKRYIDDGDVDDAITDDQPVEHLDWAAIEDVYIY